MRSAEGRAAFRRYQHRKYQERRVEGDGRSWPCATYQHARCRGQMSEGMGRPALSDPLCGCECHAVRR